MEDHGDLSGGGGDLRLSLRLTRTLRCHRRDAQHLSHLWFAQSLGRQLHWQAWDAIPDGQDPPVKHSSEAPGILLYLGHGPTVPAWVWWPVGARLEVSTTLTGPFPLGSSALAHGPTCWQPFRTRAQPAPVPQPRLTDAAGSLLGTLKELLPSTRAPHSFPGSPPGPAWDGPRTLPACGAIPQSSRDPSQTWAASFGNLPPAWFTVPTCHRLLQ